MKHFTTIVALVLAVSMAVECAAQRPNRSGPGERAQGEGGQGQRGPGQRGQGQRGQGQRGQRQRQGDPAQMAAQMMRQFDKDGDRDHDKGVGLQTRGARAEGLQPIINGGAPSARTVSHAFPQPGASHRV